jgi:hypothetical protein
MRKDEDEESGFRRLMGYAFYAVTFGLMFLNVTGAWIGSNGNLFYTVSIAGAELFVALALAALIYTRNNLRFGVGLLVFAVGVYITLENGKMAIQHAMSDVFTGTPVELTEKAALADKVAEDLEKKSVQADNNSTSNLTAIRSEIAELRAEQRTLGGSDIYGIQRILQANGLYSQATLDGVRGEETERGIVARGEAIRKRLDVLAELEAMAAAPTAAAPPVAEGSEGPVALTPAEAKRAEAIELRKQSKEVEERTVWLHIILIGLEGMRSLAVWVFLMEGTMTAARLKRKALDQLALARVNVQIAAINAQISALQTPGADTTMAQAPEAPPVAAEPPPPPPPEPEPEPAPEPVQEPLTLVDPPAPELTPQQRAARQGGLAAQHERRAAKTERLLVIGPVSTLDQMKVAAE